MPSNLPAPGRPPAGAPCPLRQIASCGVKRAEVQEPKARDFDGIFQWRRPAAPETDTRPAATAVALDAKLMHTRARTHTHTHFHTHTCTCARARARTHAAGARVGANHAVRQVSVRFLRIPPFDARMVKLRLFFMTLAA